MKRFIFLAAALLAWTACTNGPKDGYKIVGTVEGGADGDIVYLESIDAMEAVRLDSAVVSGGTFTFEGRQDSTVLRYLSCGTEQSVFSTPFFLENGHIKVVMRDMDESVTGTPTNDIYQPIRADVFGLLRRMNEVFLQSMNDSTLTPEQQERNTALMDSLERRYSEVLREGMGRNMTNPVGIYLFKMNFSENTLGENLALLEQIPAEYMGDSVLLGIKGLLDRQKETDVRTEYVDFTMRTPEGKTVRLSDYVGKGKYVLVDFWASWCGPCRQEMPDLVQVYAACKDRLEIVGVSFDDDPDDWRQAIGQLGITWPQMSDLKGWKSVAAGLYGVNSIPHTVLIDPDGVIVARDLHGREVADKLAGMQ